MWANPVFGWTQNVQATVCAPVSSLGQHLSFLTPRTSDSEASSQNHQSLMRVLPLSVSYMHWHTPTQMLRRGQLAHPFVVGGGRMGGKVRRLSYVSWEVIHFCGHICCESAVGETNRTSGIACPLPHLADTPPVSSRLCRRIWNILIRAFLLGLLLLLTSLGQQVA